MARQFERVSMSISIITCSIKPDLCKNMLASLRKTIGTDFEEIVFDNREKKYGICKVYNEAAKKANGDYLCFVHEDIVFDTADWGKQLIDFAERTINCGAISIGGGIDTSCNNFAGWWLCPSKFLRVYHDENGLRNNKKEDTVFNYNNPENTVFSKAVFLDGVFLFVKKEIWENNKFDEKTFKGFHFYDADFSYSLSKKYQNYVFLGMDTYHFSSGNKDMTYCENMYLFHKKWRNPVIKYRTELKNAYFVFKTYRSNNYSICECLKRILYINGTIFMLVFVFFLFGIGFYKILSGK